MRTYSSLSTGLQRTAGRKCRALIEPLRQNSARIGSGIAQPTVILLPERCCRISASVMAVVAPHAARYNIDVTDLAISRHWCRVIVATRHEMTFGWPTEMMVKVASANCASSKCRLAGTWRSGNQSQPAILRGSILAAYCILGVTYVMPNR